MARWGATLLAQIAIVAALTMLAGAQEAPNNSLTTAPPPTSDKTPAAATNTSTHGSGNRAHRSHHAGDWLSKYKGLPPDQQQRALENDPGFRKLPPANQAKLLERLHKFNSLSPDKQQRIIKRMATYEHLSAAQRQQVRAAYGKIRKLPPQRQTAMKTAIHELRHMPPEQRGQAVDSEKYRAAFSDQERELLKRLVQLPLAPVHAQNEEQPPATASTQ